ncbi:uncharacterized protein BDZ99DRAFT_474231 [Mytilinidion resinicola]|uniref:Uncharacterized protein n=1 Tax=Mytilinidion resinicola TaxID=574789 RepID=A0A6A6YYH2_9PEZI|nr:uncharacterized protein BDZ99DRAFT_474231 [Mytilinidion resinicola]KAF2813598.1 hypothetical protein BDZ99DRAFT_474231 [Mytilinidion resinicola]
MPLPKWSQSSRVDESRISFLDLALELREQIYEAIVVVPEIRPLTDGTPLEHKPNLNVLAVCRQTRAEASKVFVTRNTFTTCRVLQGSEYTLDRLDVAVLQNMESVVKAVHAPWVDTVTILKLSMSCASASTSGLLKFLQPKLARPWIGDFGNFIQETFPAMKQVMFVVNHPGLRWFYALAAKENGGDPYAELSSDEYSDNSNEDLYGDPHWPKFSPQYSDSASSSSDDTEDLNNFMVGMGLSLFGDADAPSDLSESEADEEDSGMDSKVPKPGLGNVVDATTMTGNWDNSKSGLREDAWKSEHSSSSSSSRSSSSSSSSSSSGSDPSSDAGENSQPGANLMSALRKRKWESDHSSSSSSSDLDSRHLEPASTHSHDHQVMNALGFNLNGLEPEEDDHNSDSDDSEISFLYGDDDFDRHVDEPRELEDETKAAIHYEIIKYWKEELGFYLGIPTWAGFEILPGRINEGRLMAPHIVVDMADIWQELKAERDAVDELRLGQKVSDLRIT